MTISHLEQEEAREELKQLRLKHRELDEKISKLHQNPYNDQFSIQKYKKQKLLLKDMIVKLESQLIPDLNA